MFHHHLSHNLVIHYFLWICNFLLICDFKRFFCILITFIALGVYVCNCALSSLAALLQCLLKTHLALIRRSTFLCLQRFIIIWGISILLQFLKYIQDVDLKKNNLRLSGLWKITEAVWLGVLLREKGLTTSIPGPTLKGCKGWNCTPWFLRKA